MGVIIPEDIKVLGSEFKDFVVELANEVNRVSEAYTDLQRVRAISSAPAGKAATDFLFYLVEQNVSTAPEEIDEGIFAFKYLGKVFESDGATITVVKEEVEGFDFGVVTNEPSVMPTQAEITGQDSHEQGTVIACKYYAGLNSAVFSSVRPRLQVECADESEERGVNE